MSGLQLQNGTLRLQGNRISFARSRIRASANNVNKRIRLQCSCSSTAADAATVSKPPAWSSHVSRRINLDLAIEEAVAGAHKQLCSDSAAEPQLAVVFVSSAYAQDYDQVVPQLRKRLPSLKFIFGSTVRNGIITGRGSMEPTASSNCVQSAASMLPGGHELGPHPPRPLTSCPLSQGYGVIGSTKDGAEEIEHAPALSVALGVLPGVNLTLTRVDKNNVPDGGKLGDMQ